MHFSVLEVPLKQAIQNAIFTLKHDNPQQKPSSPQAELSL